MLYKLLPHRHKKWATLLGGFLIHFSLGSYYSFGNLSPYMISYLREYVGIDIRYSKAIWISTLFNLAFSAGTLSSGFFNSRHKFSLKLTIFFGCMIMSAGVALTFFSIKQSYFLTLLTYGVMIGLGTGFSYIGPLSIAMKWFPDKKGLANSAILFGYGASAIIFDQVQTFYINPSNFAPDKPYSSKFPNEKYFSKLHLDLLERVPKVFLILGLSYALLQVIGLLLLANYEEEQTVLTSINNDENCESDKEILVQPTEEINSLGVNYKSPNGGMNLSQAFKSPVYFMIVTIICTLPVGPGFIVAFYKAFGLSFIDDDKFLATVGSMSSIFNSVGRFIWGYMVDKFSFKICFLVLSTAIIALVSTIYFNKFFEIKELYLVWVCAIYSFQCGLPVMIPTIIAKCFGQKNFNAIFGSIHFFSLPNVLLIALLASYAEQIGWFWLFFIGSCISLIGWLIGFVFNVKKLNGDDI